MCDLWIRSQNKEILSKYNRIAVAQITPKTQAKVMGLTDDDFGWETLGSYKTKERALEVLDEIQKLLVGDVLLFKNVDIDGELGKYLEPSKALCFDDKTGKPQIEYLHRDCIVYEMPLE